MSSSEQNMLIAELTVKEIRLKEVKAELSIVEIEMDFLGDFPSTSEPEEDAKLLKKQKELQTEKQRLELEFSSLLNDLHSIEARLISLGSDQELFRRRRDE